METNTKILLAILVVLTLPITVPLLLLVLSTVFIIVALVLGLVMDALITYPIHCLAAIVIVVLYGLYRRKITK